MGEMILFSFLDFKKRFGERNDFIFYISFSSFETKKRFGERNGVTIPHFQF